MSMIGTEKRGRLTFNYKCECANCRAEGRMTFRAKDEGLVACPDGCGAGYLPWKAPDGKWRLKCVVKPVYSA